MTKIHNVPKTLDNECVNVRRAAIEQRGKWAGAFYMEAKRQGIDLEPIMRKAIYNIGLEAGKEERKKFGDDLHAADYGRYFCTKKYHETFEKSFDFRIAFSAFEDVFCNLRLLRIVFPGV